jgi:branched-chain amino acid transport system substrate-binding protein
VRTKKIAVITVLICFLLTLLILLLPSGCAKRPPEERVIKVGCLEDFTGPAAVACEPEGRAYIDYWDYVNSKGGIDGIRIKCLWADNKYEVPLGLSQYQQIAEEGIVMYMGGFGGLQAALVESQKRDKIPSLYPVGGAEWTLPGLWSFGTSPCPADGMGLVLTSYLRDRWKEDRPMRVALLYSDSPFGKDQWLRGGLEWLETNPMIEIIEDIPYQFMAPDLSAQLTKIKSANVDAILLGGVLTPDYAVIFSGMKSLGMDTQLIGCQHDLLWFAAQVGVPLPADIITSDAYAQRAWKDVEGIRLSDEIYQELHNTTDVPTEYSYTIGWAQGIITEKAIRIALSKVGYENLDGAAIRDALESMKNVETQGLIGPVTYSPDRHDLSMVYMCEIKKGTSEIIRLTDWVEVIDVRAQLP